MMSDEKVEDTPLQENMTPPHTPVQGGRGAHMSLGGAMGRDNDARLDDRGHRPGSPVQFGPDGEELGRVSSQPRAQAPAYVPPHRNFHLKDPPEIRRQHTSPSLDVNLRESLSTISWENTGPNIYKM